MYHILYPQNGCNIIYLRQIVCFRSFIIIMFLQQLHSLSQSEFFRVQSSASSFKAKNPLFSLRSSSNCLHFLPLHPVNCILPSIFPSTTCFRRQFLHKMWPIQLGFLLFIVCKIFLFSLTLCNTSSFPTWAVQQIFSSRLQDISKHSKYFWSTFQSVKFLHHTKLYTKCSTLLVFFS